MISAERWSTLEPLLDRALALAPERRGAFLDSACSGDSALRAELDRMVAECSRPDAMLERPAIERFAKLWSDPAEEFAQVRSAVASHYALEREVGRGGMGTVYLARDLRHDRDVALKVLLPDVGAGRGAASFLGEIRVTAQLRHPHILPLFDSGSAADRLYYVTPYVEGGTLRDRLASKGALPVADAVQLICEVAGALAYAHSKGVVHRDIKPENILLGDGGAVLGDFGIAGAVEKATRQSGEDAARPNQSPTGLGTPTYMSPEQATGSRSIDHRADLYSLGVVAYEVLAGRPPFDGRSPQQLLSAHANEAPQSITVRRAATPARLARLVMRLLEKHPADRVQSAAEVVRALEGIAAHRSAKPARWIRRAVAAVALVIGVGVVAAAFVPPGSRAVVRTLLTRDAASMDARRIVVAPLQNQTGDPRLDTFGEMAADWITQALARTDEFQVVDARTALTTAMVVDRIPRMLRSRDRTVALAQETGAGTVMAGRYYAERDTVRVYVHLTNVTDGRVRRSVGPISGHVTELSALVERVSRAATAHMVAAVDTSAAGLAVGRSALPSYEAYHETRQAWERYYVADFAGAFAHARRAAVLDTTYILPLLTRAYFHSDLRQWSAVDSIVRRVAVYEASLPPLEFAAYNMMRTDLAGDLHGTLRAAQEFHRLTPASAEVGTHVAHHAVLVNRPRLALSVLGALDPTRGVLLVTPFYWNWRTAALHELGDHKAELAAAEQGVRQFPSRNSTILVLARALGALGRADDIRGAAERATTERWPAHAVRRRMLVEGSRELRAHGHAGAAREMLARALATLPPAREDTALAAVEERALLLVEAEQWDAARAELEGAIRRAPGYTTFTGARGIVAARTGDRVRAEAAMAALASTADRAHSRGRDTMWRARIAAALGYRERALMLVRHSMDEGYPVMQGFAALSHAPHVFDYGEPSVHSDPALASLFGDPELVRMLASRD